MREGLKKLFSSIAIIDEPGKGIDFEFVFGGEYAVEGWEKVFSQYEDRKQEKLELIDKIVGEAIKRGEDGRIKIVDELASPKKEMLIMKDARKYTEKKKEYEQFVININSMSETNLINMQKAIDNLQKNG